MESLAEAGGWKGASSIQRYLDEEEFRGEWLSLQSARRFASALTGLGDPPITEADILALAGPGAGPLTTRVPEIDYIAAGRWREISDPYPQGAGRGYVTVDDPVSKRAFALRVDGESMEPVYASGDIIIVDPEVQPQPGKMVVAKLDDRDVATFKQYRLKSEKPKIIELKPLNEVYPTEILSDANPGNIVGVVVEHRRKT